MNKSVRNIIIIVCGMVALIGYSSMLTIDVCQKWDNSLSIKEQQSDKADDNKDYAQSFSIVSTGVQAVHSITLPDFQPVFQPKSFDFFLSVTFEKVSEFSSHQVNNKSLLSYFSRLYRSSIQGQAP